MNGNVVFKNTSEEDFDDILKLEEESFNSYDRLDRETLVELFTEFSYGFNTILLDGEIAGYSVFLIEKDSGYIESIAVKKKYRNCGLGMSALKFMIKRIEETGFNRIKLHVRIDNMPARKLYEKEGFKYSGLAENFYTDGESACIYIRE